MGQTTEMSQRKKIPDAKSLTTSSLYVMSLKLMRCAG